MLLSMFGFNLKKAVKLTDLPDQWLGMKAESERGLLLLSLLEGMDTVTEKKEYPIRIGIAIPLKVIDEGVQKKLGLLEDEISSMFEGKSQGRLYAVITQLGETQFREFVIQTKENLDFAGIHSLLRKKFPEFEVQMVANKDEKWEMYTILKAGKI